MSSTLPSRINPLYRYLATLFILSLLLHSTAADYRVGDVVPLLKRADYLGRRSDWSEVSHSALPVFGVNTAVTLNQWSDARQFDPQKVLKLQFAFAQQKHLTPWIAFNDGQQHYLTQLVFTLTHTHDYITQVTYKTHYAKLSQQSPPHSSPLVNQLSISYEWQALPQQEPLSALQVLLVVGVLLLWMSGVLVFIDTNQVEKAV